MSWNSCHQHSHTREDFCCGPGRDRGVDQHPVGSIAGVGEVGDRWLCALRGVYNRVCGAHRPIRLAGHLIQADRLSRAPLGSPVSCEELPGVLSGGIADDQDRRLVLPEVAVFVWKTPVTQ